MFRIGEMNLLRRTTQNEPKTVKHMDGILLKTTAIPQQTLQTGVITNTKIGVPYAHESKREAEHEMMAEVKKGKGKTAKEGKTIVHTIGQVPFSGPMMTKGTGKATGF